MLWTGGQSGRYPPRTKLPVKGMEFTSEASVPEDKYRVGATTQPKMESEKIIYMITESLKNVKITYLAEGEGMSARILHLS